MTRIYIAGPMSGLPEFDYPAFDSAERLLKVAGYHVESPHHIGNGDTTRPWEWYVRRTLAQLLSCEVVALLPGWEMSRGACLEHFVARALGMETRPVHHWLKSVRVAAGAES